jgi:hypothetical protein
LGREGERGEQAWGGRGAGGRRRGGRGILLFLIKTDRTQRQFFDKAAMFVGMLLFSKDKLISMSK